jgi:hypothetical protein
MAPILTGMTVLERTAILVAYIAMALLAVQRSKLVTHRTLPREVWGAGYAEETLPARARRPHPGPVTASRPSLDAGGDRPGHRRLGQPATSRGTPANPGTVASRMAPAVRGHVQTT